MFAHQFLRVIEQYPVGLARSFNAQNFAAERTWRVWLDLRDAQGGAVCDRGVAIGAREKDRIVGRDLVEVGASGELRWLPERLDPAAAGDPFSALRFRDALFHFR